MGRHDLHQRRRLYAATGQGANDIDVSGFWPGRAVPPEHSPLIDNPSRHEV